MEEKVKVKWLRLTVFHFLSNKFFMDFRSKKFVMTWNFNASARYPFSFWYSTMLFRNYCFRRINSPGFHRWKQYFGHRVHCMKIVQIRKFFCSVFSRIQSKYGKIWTRKNSIFVLFSRSDLEYDHPIFFDCFSFDFLFFTFANTMIAWLLHLLWAPSLNFSSSPIVYL